MSPPKTEKAPRIVVGVDGSASSRAALRWAVHQAELTGGFAGALPGSAGQHCVRHARCPVVIVRGDLARAA